MSANAFCDRPHEARFAALDGLTAIHPAIGWNYTGSGITVDVPRDGWTQIAAWAEAHELQRADAWYFPLGSDRLHADLRHDASYPGSRGFRLSAHFVPCEVSHV